MNTHKRLIFLFEQYINGLADDYEKQELAEIIMETDDSTIDNLLKSIWEKQSSKITPVFSKDETDKILQSIIGEKTDKNPQKRIISIQFMRYVAAASLLLFAVISTYYFLRNDEKEEIAGEIEQTHVENDLFPGGNKAILTLDNGSAIVLDSVQNGLLVEEAGTSVLKVDDGKLAYNSKIKSEKIAYNKVTTPMGGQYQLILSDSTKVWLNAASSIRFPTAFTEDERRVEITGEAFFEVSHMPEKPFIVSAGHSSIEVLGTSFNVDAYGDFNKLEATLVKGLIRVSNDNSTQTNTLNPGQQVKVDANGRMLIEENADIAHEIAWKEGYFHFNRTDVKEIMHEVSRWYDVEVVFETEEQNLKLTGIISRDVKASSLFSILEISGVEIEIQAGNVVVK